MGKPHKKKEAFSNIETIGQFIDALSNDEENLKIINQRMFVIDELASAINSLKRIKNTKKEQIFIKFMHFIDKKLNFGGQARENRYHKIPTILASAIYIDKFLDSFKIYDCEEQMLIAKFSVGLQKEKYKNINTLFPKKMMDTIKEKNKDWMYQSDFMEVVFYHKEELHEDDEHVIEYLKEKTDGNLVREAGDIIEKLLEEVFKTK